MNTTQIQAAIEVQTEERDRQQRAFDAFLWKCMTTGTKPENHAVYRAYKGIIADYDRSIARLQAQLQAESDAVFQVTVEYADEPTCNTDALYIGQLPAQWDYLNPITGHPGFEKLQFTCDLTKVTIKRIEFYQYRALSNDPEWSYPHET